MGYQFIFISTGSVIGQYFHRNIAIANSVVWAGGSLGQIVMPQVFNYLYDNYDLRGIFIIYGAVSLQMVVGCALFRPTKFYRKKTSDKKTLTNTNKAVDVLAPEAAPVEDAGLPDTPSQVVCSNSETPYVYPDSDEYPGNLVYVREEDAEEGYTTIREVYNIDVNRTATLSSNDSMITKTGQINHGFILGTGASTGSNGDGGPELYADKQQSPNGGLYVDTAKKVDTSDTIAAGLQPTTRREGANNHQREIVLKPDNLQLPADVNCEKPRMEKHRNPLVKLLCKQLAFRLFRDRIFALFLVASVLFKSGYGNTLSFIPAHGENLGLTVYDVSVMMSSVGAIDLPCRLFVGWFANKRFISRQLIVAFCLLTAGIVEMTSAFFTHEAALWAIVVAIAALASSFQILHPVVLKEHLELETFPKAFALSQMCLGLWNLCIPPVIGTTVNLSKIPVN